MSALIFFGLLAALAMLMADQFPGIHWLEGCEVCGQRLEHSDNCPAKGL